MKYSSDKKDIEDEAQDNAEGLYHEAQADGVPYDEGLEPFTKDLPKLEYQRS